MKTDSIVKKDGIGTYIPDAESSVATVEVKSRLSDGRSMRNGLVQLVSILTEFSNKRAHLLLIDRSSHRRQKNGRTESYRGK